MVQGTKGGYQGTRRGIEGDYGEPVGHRPVLSLNYISVCFLEDYLAALEPRLAGH